jgi:hypothetical protein
VCIIARLWRFPSERQYFTYAEKAFKGEVAIILTAQLPSSWYLSEDLRAELEACEWPPV